MSFNTDVAIALVFVALLIVGWVLVDLAQIRKTREELPETDSFALLANHVEREVRR